MFQLNTINEIQTAMENGELTSKELTIVYMERIAQYDQSGPKINSIIELNPDAIHIAESLDTERKMLGVRGPLHGIPIVLKDNIDTADKMHTSAGSIALENHIAKEDSFVAQQLRDAGAVLLGKANLTEWANFMTEGMPNGYSSRGGQVLNPYGPGKLDVGGSSSGPGAAVASHFATAGIGTETCGSILSPASSNSLVGIKPTVGLISRSGIIPISHSQDTAGPMTRTVADAAILLEALVGIDKRDPATLKSVESSPEIYTDHLDPNGLNGIRIGVDHRHIDELSEEEASLFNKAIKEMGAGGAELVYVNMSHENMDSSVLFHEFKNGLNAYLSQVEPHLPVHTLSELIDFNERYADKALTYGQTLLATSDSKSGALTEPEYLMDRVKDIRLSQEEGIDAIMEKHNLDVLLSPNNMGALLPALAGYPSITVPAGYTESEGKPLGVTFTAAAFSEPKLIRISYAYEQATNHRVNPQFKQFKKA